MKKFVIVILLFLVCAVSCTRENKIVVGATSVPHAEILEQTRDYLKKQGYTLEIKVFNDYVLPNMALVNGELDANYFQHTPYLDDFNKAHESNLVAVAKIHFEPLGIYAGKKTTLESYTPGDKIIVPSDTSNHDRAMELLTVLGITGADIVLVEAQMIPMMLQDCDYAVINGNYALASNVTDKLIANEDANLSIAMTMANVIAVQEKDQNSPKIKALIESLKQDNIKEFIKNKYKGSVTWIQ